MIIKCGRCNKVFKDIKSIEKHFVEHKNMKIIKCKKCGSKINEELNKYISRIASSGGLATKKNHEHDKNYFSNLAKLGWKKRKQKLSTTTRLY